MAGLSDDSDGTLGSIATGDFLNRYVTLNRWRMTQSDEVNLSAVKVQTIYCILIKYIYTTTLIY
jgi:hypothetical protein